MIALAAMAVGVAVGLLAGGRFGVFARVRLRGEALLLTLLVLQAALPALRLRGPAARFVFLLWVASLVAAASVALLNRRLPGMPAIAVGLLLNGLVIVVNAGMPVLPASALMAAGGGGAWTIPAGDFVHVLTQAGTRCQFLSDVLPVPWPLRGVASAGDIVMLAGVAAFLAGVPLVADPASSSTMQSRE